MPGGSSLPGTYVKHLEHNTGEVLNPDLKQVWRHTVPGSPVLGDGANPPHTVATDAESPTEVI